MAISKRISKTFSASESFDRKKDASIGSWTVTSQTIGKTTVPVISVKVQDDEFTAVMLLTIQDAFSLVNVLKEAIAIANESPIDS